MMAADWTVVMGGRYNRWGGGTGQITVGIIEEHLLALKKHLNLFVHKFVILLCIVVNLCFKKCLKCVWLSSESDSCVFRVSSGLQVCQDQSDSRGLAFKEKR